MDAPLYQAVAHTGACKPADPRLVREIERLSHVHGVSAHTPSEGGHPPAHNQLTELPERIREATARRGALEQKIDELEALERQLVKAANGKWILLAVLVVIVLAVLIGQAF